MINLLFDDIFIDALERQAKCNIVKDRHLRIQSVTLEYHRHLSLSGAPLIGSVPVDQEIAVGNVLKACDHSKRRGFTASGRSDENDKLALLNIKIEIVNGVVSIRIKYAILLPPHTLMASFAPVCCRLQNDLCAVRIRCGRFQFVRCVVFRRDAVFLLKQTGKIQGLLKPALPCDL